ncbi:MAG: response regulator transcription factor, partial [Ferrovum sp.]|nr:response regulator transcription factor [Ferrovum sp.]
TLPNLTPRQREVLYALSRGFSTKLIAKELSLSEYTVKDHISDLFRILGVKNRVEAITKTNLLYLRPQ